MNNVITWDHIYFKTTPDCIQGYTIKNNNGFLIFNDGEIIFLSSPHKNFGNPNFDVFELEEVIKLTKLFSSGNKIFFKNKMNKEIL